MTVAVPGNDSVSPARTTGVKRRGYPLAHQRRLIVRELALGLKSHTDIAREHNVTKSAVGKFAQRNAREIDELRAALGDEVKSRLAGLWIADQSLRVALLQVLAEESFDPKDQIAALKAVAEELGQLPPRAQVVVVPVTHIVEGVDPELLK